MKKLIYLLLVGSVLFSFSACKKSCICKDEDGEKETIDLKDNDWGEFKNCKELQKAMNEDDDDVVTCS